MLLALFFIFIIVIHFLSPINDSFEVLSKEHQHVFWPLHLLRDVYHVHDVRVLHSLLLLREAVSVARVVKQVQRGRIFIILLHFLDFEQIFQ